MTPTNQIVIGHHYRTHNEKVPGGIVTWSQLVDRVKRPGKTLKADTPLIVLSRAPGKTKKAILAHNCMEGAWADIDSGDITLAALVGKCEMLGVAALIHSTTSANRIKETKEGPVLQGNRWRIVLPLAKGVDCETWVILQQAIAEYLGGGPEATREQQGLYSPTNPDEGYYEYAIIEGVSLDPQKPPPELQEIIKKAMATAAKREVKARSASTPKRVKIEGDSVIELVNQAYSLKGVLDEYGYERRGHNRWLHPNSTSGTAGATVLSDGGRDYYYSHHSLDTDPLADGHRHDAFDLLLHLRFNGDMRLAIKEMADELGLNEQERNKRECLISQIQANMPPSYVPSINEQGISGTTSIPARLGVEVVCAADIEPRMINWLWSNWLALRKLHVLAGAPGTGKSTIAYNMAAKVSTGGMWPDGTRCPQTGNVLIWSGEDAPDDTIIPRLKAEGADLSKIHIICTYHSQEGKRPFDPAIDLLKLAPIMEDLKPLLLIVDSIVSAVNGDSHKNTETRRSLQPLVDLGEYYGTAILGITHFTKGTIGKDPVERVTGSLAFGAMPRIVLAAAKLPLINKYDMERILVRAKSNIGPDGGGFGYSLEPVTSNGINTTRIEWVGHIEGACHDLLADEVDKQEDRSALVDAKEFLLDYLKGGPQPAPAIIEAAKLAGISERTLKRAKAALEVASRKCDMRNGWLWEMTSSVPMSVEVGHQTSLASLASFDGGHSTKDAKQSGLKTEGDHEKLLADSTTYKTDSADPDLPRVDISLNDLGLGQ